MNHNCTSSLPIITATNDHFPNISMFNMNTSHDLSNSHLSQYISSKKPIKRAEKRVQMVPGTAIILDTNDIKMSSPTKKRRKKNNQCNRLLFVDFCLRSQFANNIDPNNVRAIKQNIKRLCPLHDMLPIISDMESQPFKYHSESEFGGIGYTLRAGRLQYEYRINTQCTGIPYGKSSIQPNMSSDKYFRNHFSTWVCTQTSTKYECKHFNDLNFSSNTHLEIPLNLENILMPFMKLLKDRSSNCNLYYSVNKSEENNHTLQINGLPLEVLSVEDQINTQRLTFKVLSCGTFRRNLQPMPDACRITRVSDLSYILTVVDNEGEGYNNSNAIGLKIYSNTIESNRTKAHGDDIIIGAGFDCASRCSWHKPRIYWVSDTYKIRMDQNTGEQKKYHYKNFDLRINILWPKHMSGSMNFYVSGFNHNINSDLINLQYLPFPKLLSFPSESSITSSTSNTTATVSSSYSSFPNFNNTGNLYEFEPFAISNLVNSSVLLSFIEQDLVTNCRQYITVVSHLNISSAEILDRSSQLMINCIKNTMTVNDIFCDYFINFLCLMKNKLGSECVINGLCRLWIINPHKPVICDLWSFLHLIAHYGHLYLLMFIMQMFPMNRADIGYKFANNISSIKNNSPLMIAIKNEHLLMIEYMFEQIWKADKSLAPNTIRNILQTKFYSGKTVLATLVNHGLYSIIAYLLAINKNSNIALFSAFDIAFLQNLLEDHRCICSQTMNKHQMMR